MYEIQYKNSLGYWSTIEKLTESQREIALKILEYFKTSEWEEVRLVQVMK